MKTLSKWQMYLLIVLIGFLIYLPSLFFNFTYLDDNVLILDNFSFLKNFANILTAFNQDVFYSIHSLAAYYRPLLTVSFILDTQIGGGSFFVYHFTNIILHLLSACLLLILLIKMDYPKFLSFLGSLFFVVHPVLTAAVVWIPGRNDSLLTVFILLSFIYFLRFLKKLSFINYLISVIFFTLALFTKETALLLPLVELLYIFLKLNEQKTNRINLYLAVLSFFFVVLFWFPLRQVALTNPIKMDFFDLARSLITSLPAILLFIGKIIIPINLSVLPILEDSTLIYGLVSLALLFLLIYRTKNRRLNFIIFGVIWFLLFLVPSFIRPNPEVVADFIEHRVYLGIIGFIILLLEINPIKNLDLNKKTSIVVVTVLLFLLSVITIFYSQNFKDRLSFWTSAANNSPHSPLAHRNLGAMYYLDGQIDKAQVEFKKALSLNPKEQMVHNNLGLVLMNKDNLNEAEIEFKKELEINPGYDNAHYNLGLLFAKQNKLNEARDEWEKTLSINPDYTDAYQNLIIYYGTRNDQSQANFYLNIMRARGLPISQQLLDLFK